MQRRPPTWLYLLLCCAAQPAAASALPLDEITVIATRRPADVADVAAAVSVVDTEDIQVRKLATDALGEATGVSVQQTTPGQGAAIVRGLKGSALLHLVDGMRLSNAIFRSAPTPYFALVPTTAIERLEVVRGAPASLYGSEAVGGVVQAVSRLPDFATGGTEVGGAARLGLDSAELQQHVAASLDVGTSDLAASLGAEYLRTGNRRVGGGARIGPSGYTSRALRAVLRGRTAEQRHWLFDLHLLEQPATPRVDELVPGFGQATPSSSEFLFAPNQRLFARAHHEWLDGAQGLDWQLDAAWQRIVDDRVTRDLDAPERRRENNRSDLFGLTLNAADNDGTLRWIAGVDAYYDRIRSARIAEDVADGTRTAVASRFPDGATVTQSALFANVDWRPGIRHSLHGGLRYSDVAVDLPGGAGIDVGRFSGDLGWVFDMSPGWQLAANLGVGFRAPNVFDLGTLGNRPGNRFNIPNTNLDAEEVTHGDVGLRHRSDRWHFEFVVFALRYTDRITSVATGDVTPGGRDVVQSVNAASTSLRGIEAALAAELTDGLELRASVVYARGTQRIDDAVEEPADRVPPLGARLRLRFAPGPAWRFDAWLAAADRQDRLSARDVRDVRIDPAGTPGWAGAGVGASWYAGDGWQVMLVADNLLDHRYRVHGSGIDAPGRNLALTAQRTW